MRFIFMNRIIYVAFLTAVLQLASVINAHAQASEWALSFYGGTASTIDSDVKLKQGDDTDLRFSDVSWQSRSFERPYLLWLSYILLAGRDIELGCHYRFHTCQNACRSG